MRGAVIAFEGIDGAGKYTQAVLLAERIRESGLDAVIFSYPDYSSPYGSLIKSFLMKRLEVGAKEQAMLYAVDMLKDVDRIRSLTSKGTIVLLDRYFPSIIAYQSAGGAGYGFVTSIVAAASLIVPDIIVYLDISVETSLNRTSKRGDDLDKFEEDRPFLLSVKGFYEKQMKDNIFGTVWARINAEKSPEDVHVSVMKAVEHLLRGVDEGLRYTSEVLISSELGRYLSAISGSGGVSRK